MGILHSPSGRVERQRGEGDRAGTSPRLGSTLLEKEGEGKLDALLSRINNSIAQQPPHEVPSLLNGVPARVPFDSLLS